MTLHRLLNSPLTAALWLSLCFNAPLIAMGTYRFSYDVETHLVFADHYRRAWFSLQDPRWFGGFSVSSYPPLVHQLLALLSFLLGLDGAFGLLLLVVLLTLPIAIWRFARIFVPPSAAGYAALLGVFLPGVSLAAYDFGQLPTLVSLALALLFLAEYVTFLERGDRHTLACAAALAAATTAAHHATSLLFVPIATLVCVVTTPVATSRRVHLGRAILAALVCAATSLLTIAPFWQFMITSVAQAPIPHPTRSNYLVDFEAQALFFWAIYGATPALALHGLRYIRARQSSGLVVLATILGVLGSGGTTPLPAWLFGRQWQWLTYDRFALWAAVALLPLAGLTLEAQLARPNVRRWLVVGTSFVLLGIYAIIDATLALLGPAQPYQVDLQPIATFLSQADHARWRYQTFGFGESATRLGHLVPAATIDGGYFTARRLPELTTSGIGQVDFALWWDPSGEALRRILARAEAYALRWAFVRAPAYRPYLEQAGFHFRETLPGAIDVWENDAALPLPTSALNFGDPDLAGYLWGTLPLLALTSAGVFSLTRLVRRPRYPWYALASPDRAEHPIACRSPARQTDSR